MNRPLVERGTSEREKPPFPSLSLLFFPQTESSSQPLSLPFPCYFFPQTESLFTGYPIRSFRIDDGDGTFKMNSRFSFQTFSSLLQFAGKVKCKLISLELISWRPHSSLESLEEKETFVVACLRPPQKRCYTRRFARTIFSATQRCIVVTNSIVFFCLPVPILHKLLVSVSHLK